MSQRIRISELRNHLRGDAEALTISPTWSRSAGEELPRNREPGSYRSSASAVFPRARGVPFGDLLLPMATMPSSITKCPGMVAHRSKLLSWMPVQSSAMEFRARHYAKHVLHAVRDARPVTALIFGMETRKSDSSSVGGSQICDTTMARDLAPN